MINKSLSSTAQASSDLTDGVATLFHPVVERTGVSPALVAGAVPVRDVAHTVAIAGVWVTVGYLTLTIISSPALVAGAFARPFVTLTTALADIGPVTFVCGREGKGHTNSHQVKGTQAVIR